MAGTQELCLRPGQPKGEGAKIAVYCDADWATGESHKSTSGGYIFDGGLLVQAWSRTQQSVALSTCEAELAATAVGAQEGLFVQSFLKELKCDLPLKLYTDSSSAQAVTMRRGLGRPKHLGTRRTWLQDACREKRMEARKVDGLSNVADLMTKAVNNTRLAVLTDPVGLELAKQ